VKLQPSAFLVEPTLILRWFTKTTEQYQQHRMTG
jgi:hypothetical protein